MSCCVLFHLVYWSYLHYHQAHSQYMLDFCNHQKSRAESPRLNNPPCFALTAKTPNYGVTVSDFRLVGKNRSHAHSKALWRHKLTLESYNRLCWSYTETKLSYFDAIFVTFSLMIASFAASDENFVVKVFPFRWMLQLDLLQNTKTKTNKQTKTVSFLIVSQVSPKFCWPLLNDIPKYGMHIYMLGLNFALGAHGGKTGGRGTEWLRI